MTGLKINERFASDLLDRAEKLEGEAPNYDNMYTIKNLYNGATRLKEIAGRCLENSRPIITLNNQLSNLLT